MRTYSVIRTTPGYGPKMLQSLADDIVAKDGERILGMTSRGYLPLIWQYILDMGATLTEPEEAYLVGLVLIRAFHVHTSDG